MNRGTRAGQDPRERGRVKDDLITGSKVPRTDDLERLEMMAVHLDETKAFIEGFGRATSP